jgi:hypothetical protein
MNTLCDVCQSPQEDERQQLAALSVGEKVQVTRLNQLIFCIIIYFNVYAGYNNLAVSSKDRRLYASATRGFVFQGRSLHFAPATPPRFPQPYPPQRIANSRADPSRIR